MQLAASMGRSLAERRMTSTWRITRASGDPDPESGQAARTTVYQGPGRLGQQALVERVASSAGADVESFRHVLHLPHDAASVQRDDLAECLTNDDAPEMVGRTFDVLGPRVDDQTTAQRVPVKERI